MGALILVGGYGTRLRPLTLTTPKPLINFCNKAILEHQIYNLSKCGTKEIILAINYKLTDIKNFVNDLENKYDVQILYSVEDECLGTGGPIKLAEKHLNKYEDFFVFNSDIICSFPLNEMMKFHKENKSEATILVKEVEDPRAFGVITTEKNKIIKFEEKPKVPTSSLINAGIYIFNKKILNYIPLKNTSIEKEIFPKLVDEGILHFFKLNDFWADIGKPLDFLTGQKLYLKELEEKKKKNEKNDDDLYICYNLKDKQNSITNSIDKNLFISFDNKEEYNKFKNDNENHFDKVINNTNIEGNVLISSKAIINENCILGDNVVIGDNVIIEEGCRIKNSCIMNNSKINGYSFIENSIIGSKCTLGKWSRIEGLSVLGENVTIQSEIFLNNVFILPFKVVSSSIYEKGSIIM